jgi:uncharacterized protein (DUF1778 family)
MAMVDEVSMSTQAQVSATVSAATKERLDRFTERYGLKKNFVVEQALVLFMESRREFPDESFLATRLVLTDRSFEQVVAAMEAPSGPTPALVELMHGR